MIRPENLRDNRILISPLNWGMGHVSRCIGLIHELIQQGNTIFIACDPQQQQIFEEYFDEVIFIAHAGYPFQFKGKGNFGWDLLSRSASLRKRLKEEREEVKEMVLNHHIDVIISDHRYGFESDEVPSIFMTHQLNLPVKWYEKGVDLLHMKLMKRFKYVWVLDDDESSLAGKLSENCPENGCYIGHYSRFSLYSDQVEKSIDSVLIASGPEMYAKQLIDQALNDPQVSKNLLVVHATQMELPNECIGAWREKDQLIRSAKKIISYSGYSTIMDCSVLAIPASLSPTIGQAEQVYLAQRWLERSNSTA